MLREVKDSQYHYYIDNQGRKQGEFKEWHDNGQLVTRAYYINNDLHSEYKAWYDDGRIDLYCFYSHGNSPAANKASFPARNNSAEIGAPLVNIFFKASIKA